MSNFRAGVQSDGDRRSLPLELEPGRLDPEGAGRHPPAPRLLNSWRSILGDSDADTDLNQAANCPGVANTDQTDSDKNGIGDACGPRFAAGTAGGTVPATLALTLGTAASFGAFTPGLDRTYDASTTANVISTAGDATLAGSDPSATTPGRLGNGAFALSEPLQVSGGGAFAPLSVSPLTLRSYPGPVSNGLAAIAFRQHIGPTQPLRTGTYSKTLTRSPPTRREDGAPWPLPPSGDGSVRVATRTGRRRGRGAGSSAAR